MECARRRLIFSILLLLAFSLSGCHTPNGRAGHTYHKVVRVVDGDTFWIDDGSDKGEKIRLIGVDAPETRRSSRKEVGYYGKESKQYLTDLLLDNDVRLEYDVDPKDRYGRTLAYVYLRDGTFVNAELVRKGFGMVMTVPPNVKYADEFVEYQTEAREKQRGLWDK
jgi:Micrococcal nuclease (thermonuclease) homologs